MYSPRSTTFHVNNIKNVKNNIVRTENNIDNYEASELIDYSKNNIETNINPVDYIVDNWFYFKKDSINIGGNQSSLYNEYQFQYLIRDKIKEIIIKYYPLATEEQMTLVLQRLAYVGCGYVAAVNAFFTTNPDLEELSNILGYSIIYDGKIFADKEIDYEAMVLDFFLYYAKTVLNITNVEDIYNREIIYDHEERYSAIASGEPMSMNGGKPHEIGEIFVKYLQDHGINVELTKLFERPYSEDLTGSQDTEFNNNILDMIQDKINNGEPVIVGLEPLFKLTSLDGEELEMYNPIASHSVLVLGVMPDGKLVIQSWGKIYIVDISYVYVAASYRY